MQLDTTNAVQSLGWKDPLEDGTATRFSILSWRSPLTEEPGGLCLWGDVVKAGVILYVQSG